MPLVFITRPAAINVSIFIGPLKSPLGLQCATKVVRSKTIFQPSGKRRTVAVSSQ
jgi:hypothetical protein